MCRVLLDKNPKTKKRKEKVYESYSKPLGSIALVCSIFSGSRIYRGGGRHPHSCSEVQEDQECLLTSGGINHFECDYNRKRPQHTCFHQ